MIDQCPTCGATLKFDSGRLTCPEGHGSFGERVYVTASGRPLTDADIQALADEAERGYDVDHMLGTDAKLTQLQETGECSIKGMTVAQIAGLLDTLGIEQDGAVVRDDRLKVNR